ncbi:MAG: hypothetical protein H0U87_05650 [Acidobacteria bacterium]|jgi:hypothetical protein|nr:hypothetical protein [Acidobacteriota bacterium]
MLDTLLQIGKTLRKSGRLRHHRYIKPAPKAEMTKTGTIKTDVVYLVLPVREDFTFDFDNLEDNFHNENIIPNFYYLAYKSADADSSVKYLWGDISYSVDKKGKEQGSYRIDKTKNAFNRANKDASFFVGTAITKFRHSFDINQEQIENLLRKYSQEKNCYLHFNFQGKHWYQFEDELKAVNKKFLQDFIGEKQNDSIVLRKNLYKTLASPEKNLPFPNFSASNIYKTRTFQSEDEVLDLIYAINYSTKAVISERDIKIIILPKGENLDAKDIEEFFERRKFKDADDAEDKLIEQNKNEPDMLFAPVVDENVSSDIVEFDFVFSKAGGMTSPDVDMIELAGIKRSSLAELATRANKLRQNIEAEREKLVGKSDKIKSLNIKWSFLNILGDVTKDKKKYQSHLLRVLPQIYSGTYYKDAVLLPAFIEKTEYNIRQEKSDFNLLKFNYEFLVKIRNNNGETAMEDMKNSKSYAAGKLLGRLAQPVSWEIKSFEKNYVGLLSRRISDKQGLVAFANFINQKLAIHERVYPSLKEKYTELADILSEMENKEYHREYCAFGFFEGYFAKFEKPEKTVIEGENQ